MPGMACEPWSVRFGLVASGGTSCPQPNSHDDIAAISGSCSSPMRSASDFTCGSVRSGSTERTITSACAWCTIISW